MLTSELSSEAQLRSDFSDAAISSLASSAAESESAMDAAGSAWEEAMGLVAASRSSVGELEAACSGLRQDKEAAILKLNGLTAEKEAMTLAFAQAVKECEEAASLAFGEEQPFPQNTALQNRL